MATADGDEDIDRFLYGEEVDAVKQVPIHPPGHTSTTTTATVDTNSDDSGGEEGAVSGGASEDEIEIVLEGPKPARPTIDLNAVGTISGQSIMETDLESFEDRPWRKPGADITDYFNYGFNEQTWRLYCAKQRTLRDDPAFKVRPPMLPFPPLPFMFRPPPPPGEVPAGAVPRRRGESRSRSRSRDRRRTTRSRRSPSKSPSADRESKRRRE